MAERNVGTGPSAVRRPEVVPAATAGTAPCTRRARPDIAGDLLAAARDPRAAPPREIRVRPELYERLLAELEPGVRAAVVARGALGRPVGVPLVVDPTLPGCPGFEVVRARPTAPARPHGRARPHASGPPHAAAA